MKSNKKKSKRLLTLIILTISVSVVLLLPSCGPDYEADLKMKVLSSLRHDNNIDQKEWNDISEYILENEKELSFLLSDNKQVDNKQLNAFILNVAKERSRQQGDPVIYNPVVVTKDSIKPTINFYLENSGSMDGYINGNTQFKGAIRDLLVLLKYHYDEENIKINFINTEIHPTNFQGDITTFSNTLNTKTFKVGNVGSSNINNIFRMVLENTSKDNLSILVSDCIYSIKGSKTEELLSDQKSLTKDAFLSKFKKSENLTTTIIKLTSNFSGIYYDKDDNKTQLNNKPRPYYITIIGSVDAIEELNSKIALEKDKLEGFKEKYILDNTNYSNGIYYNFVSTVDDYTSYKPVRDENSVKNSIRAIEDIQTKGRSANNAELNIAIDLSSIPVEENYILDTNNYKLSNKNYRIIEIKPFQNTKIKPNSLNMIKMANANPTHVIVLKSNTNRYSDVTIALKKQIPLWVYETHTNDDKDILSSLDKTFGIKYLIEGISEAYSTYSNIDNFTEFTLRIKN